MPTEENISITIVVILAIIVAVFIVYDIIMIGLMSSQVKDVDNAKSDISSKRKLVKAKYNIS